MTVVQPISWYRLAELGVSFRWVRGDAFMDILAGNWRDNRELPLVERVATRSTWVDNRDVFAEINRAIGARWPEWQRKHGLIHPNPEPPPTPASRRPPAPMSRSTDFVPERP